MAVRGHTYSVGAWALLGGVDDAGIDAAAAPAPAEPVALTGAYVCIDDGGAAAPEVYVPIASATGNGQTWTELAGLFSVPACPTMQLQIYVEGPPSGVEFYVDDVSAFP